MFVYYTNSFLASMVSIFGCGMGMMAIDTFQQGDIGGGIFFVMLTVALLAAGRRISERKSQKQNFNHWWKQVEAAGLFPEIRTSAQTALAVYNQFPCSFALNKISAMNPQAADYIRSTQNRH